MDALFSAERGSRTGGPRGRLRIAPVLKQSLTPSPLIPDAEREPIRIGTSPIRLRFRGTFVTGQLLCLLLYTCWLRLTGRLDRQRLGVLIRELCQRMGVLWIKVGQLVSIRRDLFPQEICDELVKLQDQADGFSSREARSIVEEDLGAPLTRYFSEFEEEPFAAASISQLHRARLRHEGAWVAVKIRRPGIELTFAKDMVLIRRITWLLVHLGIMPHARWTDLAWEVEQVMEEELDYRYEATNMRRMRRTLRRHNVHVPKLFAKYSTQRVLVMELIRGVTMADYLKVARENPQRLNRWLSENGIDPKRVAERVVRSHLRQSFEDNLFHADLHPGNILLLRNSRFAFIDFGCAGFLEQDFLRKYDLYTQALRSRDFSKMADIYFLFASDLPPIDLSAVKAEFIRCTQAYETRRRVRGLPYHERSLGTLNRDLIELLGKSGITFDWTFLRIMRTWFTMDISLCVLMPDADLRRILTRYYRQRNRRVLRKLIRLPRFESGWLRLATELPRLASEQTVYRGTVIRRLAMIFEGAATRVAGFFAAALGWARVVYVMGAVVLLLACLGQHGGTWLAPWTTLPGGRIFEVVPSLDWQVWLVVFAGLAGGYRTLVRLKKELGQREAKLPGL